MAGEAYPRRLENLAHEAAFKLKRAGDYRISASMLLAECKQRVEAGDPAAQGAAWAEYCRVRFPHYPPSYLDRLIGSGGQPCDADDELDSALPRDPFDRAWTAFVSLDPERQQEFLRCEAAYAIHPQKATTRLDLDGRAEASNAVSWLA
jgi:hypothetical protein